MKTMVKIMSPNNSVLKVKEDTLKLLRIRKAQLDHKSINQTIKYLLLKEMQNNESNRNLQTISR